MADWNPELYLKFGTERTRPALDLALRARTLLEAHSSNAQDSSGIAALDLGCGPGNSTAVLKALFPGARLTGLDSSPEMIASARASGLAAEWVVADASSYETGQKFKLVFSNAALQWIPDQASLLGRMWAWLESEAVLAIQVPGNGESGIHRALRRTAASAPWRSRFAGMGEPIEYHEPDFYYDTLAPLGGSVEVWESSYWHVLDGRQALIDWYSGTGMRPWLDQLGDEGERQAFKAAVLESASPDYRLRGDGRVFFPFRRIFMTAIKGRAHTTARR